VVLHADVQQALGDSLLVNSWGFYRAGLQIDNKKASKYFIVHGEHENIYKFRTSLNKVRTGRFRVRLSIEFSANLPSSRTRSTCKASATATEMSVPAEGNENSAYAAH
jgi:hypothetical protein